MHRNRNRLCKYLFLLFPLIIGHEPAFSQLCDRDISPVENESIAYRQRGNRCEGFYRSKVSAGSIDIVGAVKGSLHFKLDENEVVEISSSVIKDQPINVRAIGIPIKTYYRMDAQILPGQKLIWPIADVIYPQKLSARKIGVFGWIENEKGKAYVPVMALAKMDSIAEDRKIRLYFRTSVDVECVKWRSSDVIDGACSSLGKWNNAGESYYRTGESICITLPPSEMAELCVEVAAKEKNTAHWLKRTVRVIVKGMNED